MADLDNADAALLRCYALGMDEQGWTDGVMAEADRLLPILLDAGYAAVEGEGEHYIWWFTPAGVARYQNLTEAEPGADQAS